MEVSFPVGGQNVRYLIVYQQLQKACMVFKYGHEEITIIVFWKEKNLCQHVKFEANWGHHQKMYTF
jgi:hypothetical protein